jgi:hypothetical protein
MAGLRLCDTRSEPNLKAKILKEMTKEQNGLLCVLKIHPENHKITKLVTNGRIQASKG